MLYSVELASAGLFALLGASLIMMGITRWTRMTMPGRGPAGPRPAVFLFEGQDLVDASPAARPFLQGASRGLSDLAALVALLSRGFGPDLAARLGALPPAGRLLLPSARTGDTLEVTQDRGLLRLTLRFGQDGAAPMERLSLESALEELALLRGLAEDAPQPIWALGAEGSVVWANRAYLALVDLALGRDAVPRQAPASGPPWPAAPLFAPPAEPPGERILRRRETLALPGRDEPMWFDVTTLRRGAGTLNVAADVGGLVQTESARLHFVQSLAKTFAHLSTGLAIFDRQRRLVLFNPAFVDLTGLPAAFLSSRPLVHTVLDRLREAEMLPEPKDYGRWREELAALEAAAAQGQYCDTWTLPGGRTYRVTGRPHPDGALAFLFEDISAEVGQTRRLRAELDAARAALDASDDAMAVFGATGTAILANAAYDALWGAREAGDAPGDLATEMARWEAGCAPSPLWDAMRAGSRTGRPEGTLRRLDGRERRVRLARLPRGATLATFSALPEAKAESLSGTGHPPASAEAPPAPAPGRLA